MHGFRLCCAVIMQIFVRTLLVWLASAAVLLAQEEARTPLHYKVVQAGSMLRWELPATLHTVQGRVPTIHGTVDVEPAGEGKWTIRGRIAVAADAMVTGNDRRDRTMREKVLETAKFPEIVFETTRVVVDLGKLQPGQNFSAQVTGELTAHGKAVPVLLPVDVYVFADHVLLAGSFPLHWKQYGMNDPSFGVVKVKEPMTVSFRLRAVKSAGDGASLRQHGAFSSAARRGRE
jgi:polyisoprenoid-binding protein YceI